VDDLSSGRLDFLPEGVSTDTVLKIDFSHDIVLAAVRAGRYDVVFHLAANPRVSYSVENPLITNDTNVTKTLKLMDACRGNVRRFVFASSSSVYGQVETLPTTEDSPTRPESPYGLQKLLIEQYLRLFWKLYGLDSACLRFFNVFGPNQLGGSPYSTAVSSWLSAITSGSSMRSDGDGSQTRDMCHVDNVVDACVKAAVVDGPLRGEAFNVACGESFSNAQILKYLLSKFPSSTFHTAPWRPGDVMHTLACLRKSQQVIGYRSIVTFWEGLDSTIDWYTKNGMR
jgi:nucleoside-diphosphate-sugar epimerase